MFRASSTVQERIEELLEKQQKFSLNPEEEQELDLYEEIDDYLSFINRTVRNLYLSQNQSDSDSPHLHSIPKAPIPNNQQTGQPQTSPHSPHTKPEFPPPITQTATPTTTTDAPPNRLLPHALHWRLQIGQSAIAFLLNWGCDRLLFETLRERHQRGRAKLSKSGLLFNLISIIKFETRYTTIAVSNLASTQ
jgi:hypothetical protein